MGCLELDIKAERIKYIKRFYKLECDYLVKTNELSKSEWLECRKVGLTGTDIAKICGLDKYGGPTHVWLDKLDQLEPIEQNDAMYWGTVMEPIIAKEFSIRNPEYKVQSVNAILKHKEFEFALGNIDRLLTNENGERGILEIKTASEYIKGDWDGEKVPPKYMIQLQWYMFVTGTNYGYFAALIGGNKYVQKYVQRDDELINMLFDMCSEFWNTNILKKIPPVADGSEATSNLLSSMFPESNSEEILLPGEAATLITELEDYKKQKKDIEFEIDTRENMLKQMLENNECGLVDDRKVVWKSYSRTSIDSKKLKSEQPELFEKYSKTSSYRKFDIK